MGDLSLSGDRPEAVRGKGYQHGVEPLRRLEADVALPYRVIGAEHTTAIQLNAGSIVLIDSDGLVRNEYGTILFRLVREKTARDG